MKSLISILFYEISKTRYALRELTLWTFSMFCYNKRKYVVKAKHQI